MRDWPYLPWPPRFLRDPFFSARCWPLTRMSGLSCRSKSNLPTKKSHWGARDWRTGHIYTSHGVFAKFRLFYALYGVDSEYFPLNLALRILHDTQEDKWVAKNICVKYQLFSWCWQGADFRSIQSTMILVVLTKREGIPASTRSAKYLTTMHNQAPTAIFLTSR
jgi:hypothetical protein